MSARPFTATIPVACALTVLFTTGAAALQDPPGAPLRPPNPLASLLDGSTRLSVTPAFAFVAGSAPRSALDASVVWARGRDGFEAQLALQFGGVRTGHRAYSRSGLRALITAGGPTLAASFAATVAVGAGDGPGQVYGIEASGRAGVLRLGVRKRWLAVLPAGDSLPVVGGTVTPNPPGRYSDAELSGTRTFGPLSAEATVGARYGADAVTPRWAYTSISIPVHGRAALIVAGGTQPELPEIAQRGGRFIRLALRLEAVRAGEPPAVAAPLADGMLRAERLADGRYQLRISLPEAQSVDLQGDFTDWNAVPLAQLPGETGVWRLDVAARPGIHHVAIRIDRGAWRVPPGLTAVPDGFGGMTGLLTLT